MMKIKRSHETLFDLSVLKMKGSAE